MLWNMMEYVFSCFLSWPLCELSLLFSEDGSIMDDSYKDLNLVQLRGMRYFGLFCAANQIHSKRDEFVPPTEICFDT